MLLRAGKPRLPRLRRGTDARSWFLMMRRVAGHGGAAMNRSIHTAGAQPRHAHHLLEGGLFYPTGYIVAGLPDEEQAQRLLLVGQSGDDVAGGIEQASLQQVVGVPRLRARGVDRSVHGSTSVTGNSPHH